jgi:putative oxidoreductase
MNIDARPDKIAEHSNPGVRYYGSLVHYASNLQSVALLILRIGFGFGLSISGHAHLADVPTMVQRFTEWHVPLPTFNVYVSGITEATGGILLLLGLGTRLISIPLIINFIVAYATASRSEWVSFIAGPKHWGGWSDIINDTAMPFFVAAWVMLAFGPGKISIDYLIRKMILRRERGQPGESPAMAKGLTGA